MTVAFEGKEHYVVDVDNHPCVYNITHFSFVNYVSLSRMHKEDSKPGLSVWWVKKYDCKWVWRKQTFHKRDHGKPQWFIHQGWWTSASNLGHLNVVTKSALLFFVSLQQFSSPARTGQFLTSMTMQLGGLLAYSWTSAIWMALQTHIKHLRLCCKFILIIEQCHIKNNKCPTKFHSHAFDLFFREEILENPNSGASQDATKVLVLITDGDPSDRDRKNITDRYDQKNIIRFVIGVGFDISSILSHLSNYESLVNHLMYCLSSCLWYTYGICSWPVLQPFVQSEELLNNNNRNNLVLAYC